ncbi:PucR family transcriptional regulator [Streptosporangium roseum]|uniref:PucR family transcriptional regulator n=1 Tax=Streptosporangium roseum TaxID=2001 RepID=UPI0007C661EB|nr:helix-turn-helix domain-containing protein [Streptosporangium roseum]
MQGLLLRLSTLDADAESAVRVIAYFDSLVRNHASVSVLLQATARLTQCPVGLVDSVTGRRMRVSSPGGAVERSDATAGPPAGRPLGSSLGSVWIEREGQAHGLDEIVLERFAGAAEVTLERAAALAQAGNDPALVELVLSADAGEAERARALRLLGFGPAARVQVLAGPAGDGAALAAHLRAAGHHARTARMGDTAAVLVSPEVDRLPETWRVGVGPPVDGAGVAGSWTGARTALRFTGPHPADRVVNWADLGALALFATHVPDEAISGLADVRAVEELSRRPYGAEALEAVRALCAEGSVRRAAAAVHLHHSSLAARIARAEAVLGFSLADPAGRLRAHLALQLVRLRPDVSGAGPGAARPPARRRPGD